METLSRVGHPPMQEESAQQSPAAACDGCSCGDDKGATNAR